MSSVRDIAIPYHGMTRHYTMTCHEAKCNIHVHELRQIALVWVALHFANQDAHYVHQENYVDLQIVNAIKIIV